MQNALNTLSWFILIIIHGRYYYANVAASDFHWVHVGRVDPTVFPTFPEVGTLEMVLCPRASRKHILFTPDYSKWWGTGTYFILFILISPMTLVGIINQRWISSTFDKEQKRATKTFFNSPVFPLKISSKKYSVEKCSILHISLCLHINSAYYIPLRIY